MQCMDVAALFAAAILRRHPASLVIPVADCTNDVRLNTGDTILSLPERLANYGGGRRNGALPLAKANHSMRDRQFAGCVLVSDMESWVGTNQGVAGPKTAPSSRRRTSRESSDV
jgi:60 kDa SS-A/Ro ribonucleoprotein